MKKNYWFATKRYGWGWTPCTWQGWLILFAAVLLIVLFIITIPNVPARVAWVTLVAVALIWACYLTGEKPGWRWG